MQYKDRVYREFEITEPIVLELLNSQAVNRLKKISQYGIPDKYWFKDNYSRYDHTVGVMNLLRKLEAPLEEQIAGLLHDVSQSSFSHIIDWVFGEGHKGNESYHDSRHNNFIFKTEIPKILKKYKYSVEKLLDERNFPLLENNLPDICADRIDYCLRELLQDGKKDLVSNIIKGIKNIDNKIVFSDIESAQLFSNAFLDLQVNHWASERAVKTFSLFSKAFKIAISEKIIQHDDFWDKSEEEIIEKLLKSENPEIINIFEKIEKGNIEEKTGNRVFKKFRYVDPLVLVENKTKRLSSIDAKYSKDLEKAKQQNALGILV